MTIQKILVPFLSAETGKSAFEAAAVYAKHCKAHLDVVHMRQRLAIPAGSYYPITVTYIEENVDALKKAQDQLASDLKDLFVDLAGKQSISILEKEEHDESKGATAAWSDLDASLPYDFSTRGRIADMSVLARPDQKAPAYELELVEEIIFQSARPALIVNGGEAARPFPKTIMLAWDGGREAARAMAGALPIFRQAELVVVTTVGETAWATEPPERAAAYLRLHNVHATHLHLRAEKSHDPAKLFLEHAAKKNADLIVSGAYSHNRWREILLGGFTRYFLYHADIPVLMAH